MPKKAPSYEGAFLCWNNDAPLGPPEAVKEGTLAKACGPGSADLLGYQSNPPKLLLGLPYQLFQLP